MKQLRKFCKSLAVIGLFLIVAGTGTAFGSAEYSGTGILHIDQVEIQGEGIYEVFLRAADKTGAEFILKSAELFTSGQPADATFDRATGQLHILDLMVIGAGGTRDHVTVDMVLVPDSDPMRFRVTSVIGINLPYGAGASTIAGIVDYRGNIILGSGFKSYYYDYGMYAVDFGTSVSRFVCSCTVSGDGIDQESLKGQDVFGIGCGVIKGGFMPPVKTILDRVAPDFNPSNVIFFVIPPYGPMSFHFICVKA